MKRNMLPNFNVKVFLDKPSVEINVRNLVTQNYTPSLKIEDPDVRVKVVLDKTAKKSINLDSISFSNMLPSLEQRAIDSYVKIAVDKFKNDSNIIIGTSKPIQCAGKHEKRIEKILSEYIGTDKYLEFKDFFRKSDVNSDIEGFKRGAFRVITVYQVEPRQNKRQRHSKHRLIVLFFDPYHLFIPCKYKDMNCEEYVSTTYKDVKGYTDNFEKLL